MDTLVQNLPYALRAPRRIPGLALPLLAAALGLGALGVFVDVIESVRPKPLPIREPNELVHLWNHYHDEPAAAPAPRAESVDPAAALRAQ